MFRYEQVSPKWCAILEGALRDLDLDLEAYVTSVGLFQKKFIVSMFSIHP